ncbi:hypothetical protein, conserved [Eimeria praecox]|uniref:Uncharacterized protein n=1 Tax=Eimeria praecox TaxID=51316 RepID=U6GYK2_9EIME|nr:hypothetical protein, conserved [Eimeria praecox]
MPIETDQLQLQQQQQQQQQEQQQQTEVLQGRRETETGVETEEEETQVSPCEETAGELCLSLQQIQLEATDKFRERRETERIEKSRDIYTCKQTEGDSEEEETPSRPQSLALQTAASDAAAAAEEAAAAVAALREWREQQQQQQQLLLLQQQQQQAAANDTDNNVLVSSLFTELEGLTNSVLGAACETGEGGPPCTLGGPPGAPEGGGAPRVQQGGPPLAACSLVRSVASTQQKTGCLLQLISVSVSFLSPTLSVK